MEVRQELSPQASTADSKPSRKSCQMYRVLLSCGGGEPMEFTIQLDPEVYDHIRALVHDELNEQQNRQKFEQLAVKIRGQLDQMSAPTKSPAGLTVDLHIALND